MAFEEKRRQEYLDEEDYISYSKWIGDTLEYLEKDSAGLIKDSEFYGVGYTADPRADINLLCDLIILNYTAGEPIEKLESLLEKLINYIPESVRVRSLSEDYGCDILNSYVFDKMGISDDLYNLSGLCILFNRPDLMDKLTIGIDKLNNESTIESLIALLLPNYPITTEPLPQSCRFRIELQRAIEADTEKDTIAYLKKYLKAWYVGMRKVGWHLIDTHLEQQPAAPAYRGYWAFEAAAVAYFKNIDDIELRSSKFYPKDIVDHVRKLNPKLRS